MVITDFWKVCYVTTHDVLILYVTPEEPGKMSLVELTQYKNMNETTTLLGAELVCVYVLSCTQSGMELYFTPKERKGLKKMQQSSDVPEE